MFSNNWLLECFLVACGSVVFLFAGLLVLQVGSNNFPQKSGILDSARKHFEIIFNLRLPVLQNMKG